MKKLMIMVFAVSFSVILSFDDSISSVIITSTIEAPAGSDCQGVTHHHHASLTDHFFLKNTVLYTEFQLLQGFGWILSDQPVSSQYLSFIWQPPQITC